MCFLNRATCKKSVTQIIYLGSLPSAQRPKLAHTRSWHPGCPSRCPSRRPSREPGARQERPPLRLEHPVNSGRHHSQQVVVQRRFPQRFRDDASGGSERFRAAPAGRPPPPPLTHGRPLPGSSHPRARPLALAGQQSSTRATTTATRARPIIASARPLASTLPTPTPPPRGRSGCRERGPAPGLLGLCVCVRACARACRRARELARVCTQTSGSPVSGPGRAGPGRAGNGQKMAAVV